MNPLAETAAEPIQADEALLTDAAGVARLLGVSKRHVQALDSSGRIPAGISLGRSRRWRVDEIRQWCEAGCPARAQWLAMKGTSR
jgi:excisionase family DNA binding protein